MKKLYQPYSDSTFRKLPSHLNSKDQSAGGETVPNRIYFVADIYVGSALKAGRFPFLGFDMHGERGVFKFEDSDELQKVVADFYGGRLTQNLREYIDSWMSLKKLVAKQSFNGG